MNIDLEVRKSLSHLRFCMAIFITLSLTLQILTSGCTVTKQSLKGSDAIKFNKVKTSICTRDFSFLKKDSFAIVSVHRYDTTGNEISFEFVEDPNYYIKYRNLYDSLGNKVHTTYYKRDSSIEYHLTYKYDKEGRKVEFARLYPNKTTDYKYVYTYDAFGNKTDEIYYDYNNSINVNMNIPNYTTRKTTHKYDGNGNELERKIYITNNVLQEVIKSYYNNAGLLMERQHHKKDSMTRKSTFKYSRKREVVEENSIGEYGYKKIYSYDRRGNLTQHSKYNPLGWLLGKWEYKYNKDNNRIEDKTFNNTGSIVKIHSYTYYKNGLKKSDKVYHIANSHTTMDKYYYEYHSLPPLSFIKQSKELHSKRVKL